MSESKFRELIDAAIEAREPLDTPSFARLAESASPADSIHWRSQMRLDRAVEAWRSTTAEAPAPRLRRMRESGLVAATLALGLSAVIVWSTQAETPTDPGGSEGSVASVPPAATPPDPVVAARPPAAEEDFGALAMAAGEPSTGGFDQAAETTKRLAYAFEPVGEQVGSVVRMLIDAVPGSDVFSL